jgi:hypothetical protein
LTQPRAAQLLTKLNGRVHIPGIVGTQECRIAQVSTYFDDDGRGLRRAVRVGQELGPLGPDDQLGTA